jgi:hypothetical protein
MQRKLAATQVAAFYHDGFVQRQVEHFTLIVTPVLEKNKVIVDIGGGCGYFSRAIKEKFGAVVRVVDADEVSIQTARSFDVDAVIGDALNPDKKGDEGVVCFNLILHHLIGSSERQTATLQVQALEAWAGGSTKVFVNEYIYESWFLDLAGSLIYKITSSKILSAVAKAIAKFVPSLEANTFGVGVRFRSNREWRDVFAKAGFLVQGEVRGEQEFVSLPRRLLFIREIRRDSFLLASK